MSDSDDKSRSHSDKREFRHESLQDRKSLGAYLEALQKAFEDGTIIFSDGSGDIELHPHGLIRMEVEATHKRNRRRLQLKFTWREPDESLERGTLEIGSGEE